MEEITTIFLKHKKNPQIFSIISVGYIQKIKCLKLPLKQTELIQFKQ